MESRCDLPCFGVMLVGQIDIALTAQKENLGLIFDFEIEIDPFIGIKEAARRRSHYECASGRYSGGEIADPYGGTED